MATGEMDATVHVADRTSCDRNWFSALRNSESSSIRIGAMGGGAHRCVDYGTKWLACGGAAAAVAARFGLEKPFGPTPVSLVSEAESVLMGDFGIGLILGRSGAGKSTVLRRYFGAVRPKPTWCQEHSVVSHFETPREGSDALQGVGLNSVPAWLRPYEVLSTGERARADLARRLVEGTVVEDEFTSTLDRRTAMSVSVAVARHCRMRRLRRAVFATCHDDVARALQPDWVIELTCAWTLQDTVSIGASRTLHCKVALDEHVREVAQMMDISFSGSSLSRVPDLSGGLRSAVPTTFVVGLIIGPSGTGKSSLLQQFGTIEIPRWEHGVPLINHFSDLDDAQEKLCAAGLVDVTAWLRPYSMLSTGEQHRADFARVIGSGVCVDEFTSTVDRALAKRIAAAIGALSRARAWSGMVFAGCHSDIAKHLRADWVYDTLTQKLEILAPSPGYLPDDFKSEMPPACVAADPPAPPLDVIHLLSPVTLRVRVERCGCNLWQRFAPHHYLSASLAPRSKCFVAVIDDCDENAGTHRGVQTHQRSVNLHSAIGFVASKAIDLPRPKMYGTLALRGCYRESRLVVVPEFQGLGLGKQLSEAVAQLFVDQGIRYISKAAHPRVAYRDSSPLWSPAPDNGHLSYKAWDGKILPHPRRCYNHEYVGSKHNECPGAGPHGKSAKRSRSSTCNQGEAISCTVQRFLADARCVEAHVASRLQSAPEVVQRAVLGRGTLVGTRNPTAVLNYRLREAWDAELNRWLAHAPENSHAIGILRAAPRSLQGTVMASGPLSCEGDVDAEIMRRIRGARSA
mmetsp:Transcript_6837/g.17052  ORF Transcript_6837/g.17052 Transcript_6837/m.17052 type:complete len:799 (-) Transcript_6837:42-2438(-)